MEPMQGQVAERSVDANEVSSGQRAMATGNGPHKRESLAAAGKDFGCQHYRRKCKFYTPCCQKTYRCRSCHDSQEDHVLQRDDVQHVDCCVCGTRQRVQPACENCGTIFAKYFCFECKLYDDEDKEQFHCDGCGICRIGGTRNFFHCPTCNMCLPTHLKGKHRCIENVSKSNCPICQEDIHTSREPSQIPTCNHLIHKSCFDDMIRAGHFYCPVCARSLVDMTGMWSLYDQLIKEAPMPLLYSELFVQIYCRDCLRVCKSPFHVVGLKCVHCDGYNTVREKGPLLRKNGHDSYSEADLNEDDVTTSTDELQSMASALSVDQQSETSGAAVTHANQH